MKILCVKQYKCTVFMNSQEACINGNSILLGTSSTCEKVTKCTETSHGKVKENWIFQQVRKS